MNDLDYYFKINDDIFLCEGNNDFYRHLETKALLNFGPTICMRWNSHDSKLKKITFGLS